MNNNYRKAQKMIDCYNQQNKNTTFTCFGPTGPTARCNKSSIYFFKW